MRQVFSIVFCYLTVFSAGSQTFNVVVNQTIPDDNTTIAFDIPITGLPSIIDQNFGLESVCLSNYAKK